jgi:hypothetical protein
LDRLEGGHQPVHLGRWFEAQLSVDRGGEPPVPQSCLGDFADGDIGLDEGAVGALPERLVVHGEQPDADRLARATACGELPTEGLQGGEPEFPEPLALDGDPVVVVLRQEFLGEFVRPETDVALPPGTGARARRPPEDPVSGRLDPPDVDLHVRLQVHGGADHRDQVRVQLSSTPQRRAEVGRSSLDGQIRPEEVGDHWTTHRPLPQCEHGQKPADAVRDSEWLPVAFQGETAEQAQPQGRRGGHR